MRPPSSRPPARHRQHAAAAFLLAGIGKVKGCSLIILACGIHTLRVQIDSSIKVFRVSYLFRL